VFFFVFISKFPQHPNDEQHWKRGEKTGTEAADDQRPLFAREEEEEEEETASGRGGRAAKDTTSEREEEGEDHKR
jgi:hypothetical protein